MDPAFGLIATDLSEYSRGLSACIDLYWGLGLRKVHILHVDDETAARSDEDTSKALEAFARVFEAQGMQVEIAIQKHRDPAEAILQQAESLRPDLLIVGSHGRGFLGRFFMGSVSQKLLAHWGGHILIERLPKEDLHVEDLRERCRLRHKRVIMASSHPRTHGPAVDIILRLASSGGLQRVLLFTSLELSEMVRVQVLDKIPEMERSALETLQKAASPLRELSVPVEFHIASSNTARSLQERAGKLAAGLAILEINGPNDPWNELAGGIVYHLPCSALVLR